MHFLCWSDLTLQGRYKELFGWLTDCLAGWLVGYLTVCLIGWLIDWPVGCLVGCYLGFLIDCLTGWLTARVESNDKRSSSDISPIPTLDTIQLRHNLLLCQTPNSLPYNCLHWSTFRDPA
jgi:hypothetical protein